MSKTFAERCHIAQQFLPDAQYKAMLTKLHTEMLAALAEQPAQQEPVAWIRPSGRAMLEAGGYCTVYASNGMSNHSIPLYTTPQAPKENT